MIEYNKKYLRVPNETNLMGYVTIVHVQCPRGQWDGWATYEELAHMFMRSVSTVKKWVSSGKQVNRAVAPREMPTGDIDEDGSYRHYVPKFKKGHSRWLCKKFNSLPAPPKAI